MSTTIRTNNVPRFIIEAYELSAQERAEFDWLDWEAIDAGEDSASFFRFKGQLYALSEFMRCDHAYGLQGWDGYHSDTMFSGVLIKYVDEPSQPYTQVVVGQYFS